MTRVSGTQSNVDGEAAAGASRLRAVAAGVGITALAIVVSLVGGVAFAVPLFLFQFDVASTAVFLALTVAGQVGFLLVAYVYARRRGLRVETAVPSARGMGYGLGGALAAVVVAVALSTALQRLDLVPGSVIGDAATADPTVLVGLAVLSVVVVAPVEEFLFRGVVQGRLREAFGPVGAVAGSSLLFGSVHLGNYTGALAPVVAGALLIACVGVVLGALYERTGNLAVPVVAHAAYNVTLLGFAYLAG